MHKVMSGERPARPRHTDLDCLTPPSNATWSLIESCWAQDWASRPRIDEVVRSLVGSNSLGDLVPPSPIRSIAQLSPQSSSSGTDTSDDSCGTEDRDFRPWINEDMRSLVCSSPLEDLVSPTPTRSSARVSPQSSPSWLPVSFTDTLDDPCRAQDRTFRPQINEDVRSRVLLDPLGDGILFSSTSLNARVSRSLPRLPANGTEDRTSRPCTDEATRSPALPISPKDPVSIRTPSPTRTSTRILLQACFGFVLMMVIANIMSGIVLPVVIASATLTMTVVILVVVAQQVYPPGGK
jgi:hypothetical protein